MNFCTKCGGQNAANSVVCAFCANPMSGANPSINHNTGTSHGGNNFGGGYPPFGQPSGNQGGFGYPPPSGPQPSKGLGITGFVLGLIGVIVMCCGIGPLLGIPAIICSALQLKKNKTSLAIAGLILGILAVSLGALLALFFWPAFIEGFIEGWNEAMNAARMLR